MAWRPPATRIHPVVYFRAPVAPPVHPRGTPYVRMGWWEASPRLARGAASNPAPTGWYSGSAGDNPQLTFQAVAKLGAIRPGRRAAGTDPSVSPKDKKCAGPAAGDMIRRHAPMRAATSILTVADCC